MKKPTLILFLVFYFIMSAIIPAQDQPVEEMSDAEKKIMVKRLKSTAYAYRQNKDYDESIEPLREMLELDPKNKNGWKWLADSYTKLMTESQKAGDDTRATVCLDSAKIAYYGGLEHYPEYDYFYSMLSYIYSNTGDTDSAIVVNERIVELYEQGKVKKKKTALVAYMILGKYAYLDDEVENDIAIEYYEKAAEIEPDNQEVLKMLEELRKQEGSLDELIANLEEQIKLKPNEPSLYIKIMTYASKLEDYEKAAETGEKLIVLTPDNAENHIQLGKAYQHLEEFPKAIRIYKKAIKIDARSKEALSEIAICYANEGNIDAAKSYVCKALRYHPRDNRAKWVKGEIIEKIAAEMLDDKGNITYAGKLVYREAVAQFKKLVNDPTMGRNAALRVKFLKQFTPTTEDDFMHKDEEKPVFNFGC